MKPNFLYGFIKTVFGPLVRLFYRVRTEGLENFPREGPVIVAANHLSFADSVFLPLCAPRQVVFLALAGLFKSRKVGWILRGVGMIPVERSARGRAALEAGLQVLEAGGAFGVFPEGTRSPDGRLYRGRTGVARVAIRSGVPVVPVGLVGTYEVWPRGRSLPRIGTRVTVRFGEPCTFGHLVEGADDKEVLRRVTDDIMHRIAALTGQEYVDEYQAMEASPVRPAPAPDAGEGEAPGSEGLAEPGGTA